MIKEGNLKGSSHSQPATCPLYCPPDYKYLAGSYSFWEYLCFGKKLQQCRKTHWKEMEDCKRILLLGDGDGRFSSFLAQKKPSLKISILEASPSMTKVARRRRRKLGVTEDNFSIIGKDILNWQFEDEKPFDAVVAQFFFDSFSENEVIQIIDKISSSLKPGGKLLVSEFHVPDDTRIGNWRARMTLRFLYFVFRILTGLKTRELATYRIQLEKRGFQLNKAAFYSHKSLVSQVFRAPGQAVNEKYHPDKALGIGCETAHRPPYPNPPNE